MISMFNDHYNLRALGKDRRRGKMRQDPSLRRSFLTLAAATSMLVVTLGWYFLRDHGVSSRIRVPAIPESSRESKVR